MASLTLSCRAANTNLGSVRHDSIIYAERGAAITLARGLAELLHRLSASPVSSSDVEVIVSPGVHPSGEVKGRRNFTAQGRRIHSGQRNKNNRKESLRRKHLKVKKVLGEE